MHFFVTRLPSHINKYQLLHSAEISLATSCGGWDAHPEQIEKTILIDDHAILAGTNRQQMSWAKLQNVCTAFNGRLPLLALLLSLLQVLVLVVPLLMVLLLSLLQMLMLVLPHMLSPLRVMRSTS